MERERALAEARTKTQREREERQRKLAMSKKSIYESKRSTAGSTKDQERQLREIAQQTKDAALRDKWAKAEEIRKKYALCSWCGGVMWCLVMIFSNIVYPFVFLCNQSHTMHQW